MQTLVFKGKRILLGYNKQKDTTKDVKILVTSEKKNGFVELKPFRFINLYLECEKIHQELLCDIKRFTR